MLEVNDLIAGVRVGLDVELCDQLVEEGVLARIGDEDELVGAVVGREREGVAEGLLGGVLQHLLHTSGQVAGLGEVQGVELGGEISGGGTVEGEQELLDALQVGNRVGDKKRIGVVKQDRAAELDVEQGVELGDEVLGLEVFKFENFGSHTTAGGQAEGGFG